MSRLRPLLACLLCMVAALAAADPLEPPAGPVILTVGGAIRNTTDGEVAQFDRAMLERLPQRLVRTHTPWTDGVNDFEGPLGRALLEFVGARGETLEVTALNDYSATVPVEDFFSHDVILAMKMNGEYMRVRDKGPLFIIYPFDSDSELTSDIIHYRSVWQIQHIQVK
ncbi:oxidoreductase [Marinobacterium nitratireducens]|uniref:Oxidoreductase n=1 Tax=Marinobacterium nitratireducens TaxID=518897 RepID=A0A918DWP3_9GAMM|nr:molybdopterin-dependent oxidoreductase [Marinobacterium nitratireducens]GGO87913.1 oxidoreductase [Marinobacterium nitratireducens]